MLERKKISFLQTSAYFLIVRKLSSSRTFFYRFLISLTFFFLYFYEVHHDSLCSPEHEKQHRLISWNKFSKIECVKIGGCIGRDGTCLSRENWSQSEIGPVNIGKANNEKSDFDNYKTICPSAPYSLCGSTAVPKQVCDKRFCCHYPNGQCGIPISRTKSRAMPVYFTVIITCFKQENVISDSLHSIVHQSYTNWELLVIDDGSPSRNCYRYSQSLKMILLDAKVILTKQIRVIYKENTGLIDTRNFGSKLANGSYICFLDADDILFPSYLENAAKMIVKQPDATVIYGDQVFIDSKNRTDIWNVPPVQDLQIAARKAPLGPLPTMSIIRKSSFDAVHKFSAEMVHGMEDYDLWLRLLRFTNPKENLGSFIKLSGPQSWYRVSPSSMSRSKRYNQFALSMLRIKHNTLYNSLCADLSIMFCNSNPETIFKLDEALQRSRNKCFTHLWLALFKAGMNCLHDAENLILDSSTSCTKEKDDLMSEEESILFNVMFNMFYSQTFPGVLKRPKSQCLERVEQKCRTLKFKAQPKRYSEAIKDLHSVKYHYIPYSFLQKKELREIPDLGNDAHISIQKYIDKVYERRNTPKLIHFVFGFEKHQLHLEHYQFVSIYSAILHNPLSIVFLHCPKEPKGLLWSSVRNLTTLIIWRSTKINFPRCPTSLAHISEYVGLLALYKYGGILLRTDVLTFREINVNIETELAFSATSHTFNNYGNASKPPKYYPVIIAARKSRFLKTWMRTFKYYRPRQRDTIWNENSGEIPYKLVMKYKRLMENKYVSFLPFKTYISVLPNETEIFFQKYSSCRLTCFLEKWQQSQTFSLWIHSQKKEYRQMVNNIFEFPFLSDSENTLIFAILENLSLLRKRK